MYNSAAKFILIFLILTKETAIYEGLVIFPKITHSARI